MLTTPTAWKRAPNPSSGRIRDQPSRGRTTPSGVLLIIRPLPRADRTMMAVARPQTPQPTATVVIAQA